MASEFVLKPKTSRYTFMEKAWTQSENSWNIL